MEDLFTSVRNFNQDVFRNIVSLRQSEDLFDDLSDDNKKRSKIAALAEMRVKEPIPSGFINRGFHYTHSVAYPFETEPYLMSRYGDGSYGVWYGSLELETTIHETAYHMMQVELGIEGLDEIVVRERAVYKINCCALLIDLTGKEKKHPQLMADDYNFTQQVGYRLQKEGHPGLLASSVRCLEGVNSVIFNPDVLNALRLKEFLTYHFDPAKREVSVEKVPGKVFMTVSL